MSWERKDVMSIEKRFAVLLENKLNQLAFQGYTVFERWELLCWFNKERITTAVWVDIKERWSMRSENEADTRKLSILKCDDTTSPQKYIIFITDCIEDL